MVVAYVDNTVLMVVAYVDNTVLMVVAYVDNAVLMVVVYVFSIIYLTYTNCFLRGDYRRAGLVCVLMNEMQRIKKTDGQINLLETVQLMKQRHTDVICSSVSA